MGTSLSDSLRDAVVNPCAAAAAAVDSAVEVCSTHILSDANATASPNNYGIFPRNLLMPTLTRVICVRPK